jgi:glycosyltransferase involved in cell wall biosynthesis
MISIVICARTPTLKPKLEENIRQLMGCEYEVIVIDNSENRYSIFEAYNLGIDLSRGDLICFMHDDVLLHTKDWGVIAERLFAENPGLGLLGISGARVKTRIPSAWWDCPKELQDSQLIQHRIVGGVLHVKVGFKENNLPEAAAIDGVFMILRKNTGIRMNTKLRGFHCYDLSLSIECRIAGYKVHCTNQILVEHFSEGTLNKAWFDTTFILHKLYKNELPFITEEFQKASRIKDLEFINGMKMIKQLLHARYRRGMVFRIWLRMFFLKPFSKVHLSYCKQILLKVCGFNKTERVTRNNA